MLNVITPTDTVHRLIPAGVIDKLVKVKNRLFRNDMFTYDKSPGRVAGIKEMPPSQLLYAEIKVLVKKMSMFQLF